MARDLAGCAALVVGAGGLGCPVLLGLAEAGVGRLRLVDPDVVERSNLQRQVLYETRDVGRPKVDVAAERIRTRFPDVRVETLRGRLGPDSVDRLLDGVDVVVDATDDPGAGFLLNDAARKAGLPAVLGGVIRFEGIVMGVAPESGACFRCLFEDEPEPSEVRDCATAGVLGAMAGVVGHLQVERALGLLQGETLAHAGFVTTIDGTRGRVRRVPLHPTPGCPGCASPTRDPEEAPMAVTIKIPTSLRKFASGEAMVSVEASTVREALDGLEAAHPGVIAKICDGDGNLRRFINVYADEEDIRFLDNLDTGLGDGSELQIVPAIAGG